MLPVSYDPALVTASILVAMMAAFMGLHLSSGGGLAIGAIGLEEIALSILAAIIQTRRRARARTALACRQRCCS